jgi:methionyl aminopeptidase
MTFHDRRVTLKSAAQIERMAVAGRLVADALDAVEAAIRPGVSTLELDTVAEGIIRSLVSIDAGAIVDGWHGDGARTFIVGAVPEPAARLVAAARAAMMAGIAAAVPGNHIGDISAAVEDVALAAGLGVVRPFVGHGIGTEMHEEPQVPNYRLPSRGRRLEVGLCLAIEPMFTLGRHEVRVEDDGWTVRTVDGGLAAHFEHSMAVTADGPRILTVNRVTDQRLPAMAAT